MLRDLIENQGQAIDAGYLHPLPSAECLVAGVDDGPFGATVGDTPARTRFERFCDSNDFTGWTGFVTDPGTAQLGV